MIFIQTDSQSINSNRKLKQPDERWDTRHNEYQRRRPLHIYLKVRAQCGYVAHAHPSKINLQAYFNELPWYDDAYIENYVEDPDEIRLVLLRGQHKYIVQQIAAYHRGQVPDNQKADPEIHVTQPKNQ